MKYFLLLLLLLISPVFASQNCNEALFYFEGRELYINNLSHSDKAEGFNNVETFINPLQDRLNPNVDAYFNFEYSTEVIRTSFNFEELIPSCAVDTKDVFALCVKVSPDGENWSKWFMIGFWGLGISDFKIKYIEEDKFAKLKTDYISLKEPVSYFQLRILAMTDSIKIRSLSAAISSEKTDKNLQLARNSCFMNKYCGIALDVPFRSQAWEDKKISGHICSPVSIGMIMDYFGVNIKSKELSEKVYDIPTDMYGIWWRSVQAAAGYGFDGYVRYFRSYDEVGEYILQGIPIAACVCFGENELSGSATEESEGHVLVLSGFDSKGNPICRDGAWKTAKEGIVIYGREEFKNAWFNRGGGVGYVIFPHI